MNKKNGFFFFSLLMISSLNLSAKNSTARFKIPKQKRAYYSFKEACLRLGYKETLIVEAVGVRALDCMGTKVSTKDICLKEKKFNKEPFVRGYIDTKNKQVVCQFGKAALLALSCESDQTRKFCRSPQKSCLDLKEKYAGELAMSHHSRLFKGDQEILHCYYKESKTAQKSQEEEVNIPEELTF